MALFPLSGIAQDATSTPSPAPYIAPKEIIDKIKDEGMNHSQLMATLSYITEGIGARLTSSPALKSANAWTRDTMALRGMQAHLEQWGPFGRGWTIKKFSAQIETPYVQPIVAYPKAWTPSTKGEVTGEVVYFDAKDENDFARFAGKLKGKIVLVSEPRELKAAFDPMAIRRTDESLVELSKAPDPATLPPAPPASAEAALKRLTTTANRLNFLKREGVAVMVDNSTAGSGGTVFVAGASVPQDIPKIAADALKRNPYQPQDKKSESRMIPQMTMATENYNRLIRMIKLGIKPTMTVNIQSQFYDDDLMNYNTIAEIPGTDLKDEVVMLGAHMDSWQGATGATDNACNVATVMEAARIIEALGLQPRRTIRVALWTGEEEGLLGSTAYVKAHFGEMTPTAPGEKGTLIKKPDYDKLSAYYNNDGGSGKIRGMFAQGNTAAAPIFAEWLKPFADMGGGTLTLSNTGSTDHISFDRVGLPGFQFIQDGLEYWSRTHHSTQDVYDRVQEDDVKFNSVIMAAFAYQTAMMDQKMPRKPMN